MKQYTVIEKLNRFYSDEVYYKVHKCKTWKEVCQKVDAFYCVFKQEPIPVKHFKHHFYGETWVFKGREVGSSDSPDTITCTVFANNVGEW